MDAELSNLSSKLVLVADDDIGVLKFISMHVQRLGLRVDTAMTGPDTIQKIAEVKPDLLILDLMMPGFGGFEILRKLRDMSSETPIIIVTARQMDESTRQTIRSEANVIEFILKPVSLLAIQAAVAAALKMPPSPNGSSV